MKDKLPNAFMSALLRGFRALAGPFRVRAIGIPVPELDGRGAAVALVQQENRNLRELLATSKREGQSAIHVLDGLREEYENLRRRYAISQEPTGQSAIEALDKLRVEHDLLQRRYAISQEATVTGWFREQAKRFAPFVANAIQQEVELLLEERRSARRAHADTQQPAVSAPEKRQRIRNKPKRTSAKAKP